MVHSIIKERYLNHSRIFVFFCMIILIVTGCESRDSNTPPPVDEQIIFGGPGPDTVIDTISVSDAPWGVAATPDGSKVYVTNSGADEVTVISTSDNSVAGTIDTPNVSGGSPRGIAVSGNYVYVANYFDNTVSKIYTTTNLVVLDIDVGSKPQYLAASGGYVYVTNFIGDTVYVIETATNDVIEMITVGDGPTGIAVSVSPDGSYVYVANYFDDTVSRIDITLPMMSVIDDPITVGNAPKGVAVTPDGRYVYVANSAQEKNDDGNPVYDDGNPVYTVSVIDTDDDSVSTIRVGKTPSGIAVSPDGTHMYVTNWSSESVSVINVNDVSYEGEILLGYEGSKPLGIAITEIAGTGAVYVYVANENIDAVTVIGE